MFVCLGLVVETSENCHMDMHKEVDRRIRANREVIGHVNLVRVERNSQ